MDTSKTADSLKHPRDGWDAKFKEMADNGDDALLDKFITTIWDEDEWELFTDDEPVPVRFDAI